MAQEINSTRFTSEQKEAWVKCKALLKDRIYGTEPQLNCASARALHIAMSQLRLENGRKHRGPIEQPSQKHEAKAIQYEAIRKEFRLTERIAEWIRFLRDPSAKKLYILVDHTLSPAQKAVQSAHAAAQFIKQNPLAPWINGTLVLLCAASREGFVDFHKRPQTIDQYWRRYLHHRSPYGWMPRYWSAAWCEPDMGNQVTAICLCADFESDRIGQDQSLQLI